MDERGQVAMDMQTMDIIKDFGLTQKTARLPWVLEVELASDTLRVEILKTSNENAPWHADAYRQTKGGWTLIAPFEVDGRSKADAIRLSLPFLV